MSDEDHGSTHFERGIVKLIRPVGTIVGLLVLLIVVGYVLTGSWGAWVAGVLVVAVLLVVANVLRKSAGR